MHKESKMNTKKMRAVVTLFVAIATLLATTSLVAADEDVCLTGPSSQVDAEVLLACGEAEWLASVREASRGSWELYTLDEFLFEVDDGVVSSSFSDAERRVSDTEWIVNYIELEEPASAEDLLASIRARSRGSWELYTLDESEAGSGVVSPSSSALELKAGEAEWFDRIREASRGSWELYTLDEFVSEVGDGVVSPSSSDVGHRASDIEWFVNYFELTEPGTDPE
jgi:hypothetical protein